jgi:hypothetical protein
MGKKCRYSGNNHNPQQLEYPDSRGTLFDVKTEATPFELALLWDKYVIIVGRGRTE